MLIDIHTHNPVPAGVRGIRNLYRHFDQVEEPGFFSIGLHPWHVTETGWKEAYKNLQQWCHHRHVVAIGECGLDKVCGTSFSLQQEVFKQQVQLAKELNKPLLVHCVKAYQEVLQLLQEQTLSVPVVFHGFNKSTELGLELVKKGYYLSFGKKLLQSTRLRQLLLQIPSSSFFLETDDAALSIAEVYQITAATLQIQEKALSLQLAENVARVFGI